MTLVLALALGLAPAPSGGTCTCLTDSVCNGWCGACRVGYVAAVQIRSRQLFEALDAHGHEIDPGSFTCATCRIALQRDGFCASCNWGFIGGLLYYSRLSYLLARGEPRGRDALACPDCLKHSLCRSLPLEKDRWCERCGIGMVGNVAFRDRREFDAASKEFELLLRAVKESARCEDCAVAMFMGATCHKCGLTWSDGVANPVDPPAPKSMPGGR
jgi:hypothetical protein